MALITYQIVKKPIEERLIDAACIYWDVERSYFYQNTEDRTVTYRKSIIYYLIKQHTTYSYRFMAEKFGFLSHQPVARMIDNISATQKKIQQHFNDINQITHLADILDADLITVDRSLINKEIKKG